MKKIITILVLFAFSFSFVGCDNDAKSGALVGTAVGAGIGQLAGGDTKSTMIGAAVGGGVGYVAGNESDKKKEKSNQEAAAAMNEETIMITNSNGSQTPVKIVRQGDKYIGPKGEIYSARPTEEQLQKVYGF